MIRLSVAGGLALIVALLVAAFLPPSASYPPFCSSATNVGSFCISYNSLLGRYDVPPAGVPADFARFATVAAERTVTAPTLDARLRAAAIAFAMAVVVGWTIVGSVIEARRLRTQ